MNTVAIAASYWPHINDSCHCAGWGCSICSDPATYYVVEVEDEVKACAIQSHEIILGVLKKNSLKVTEIPAESLPPGSLVIK